MRLDVIPGRPPGGASGAPNGRLREADLGIHIPQLMAMDSGLLRFAQAPE